MIITTLLLETLTHTITSSLNRKRVTAAFLLLTTADMLLLTIDDVERGRWRGRDGCGGGRGGGVGSGVGGSGGALDDRGKGGVGVVHLVQILGDDGH